MLLATILTACGTIPTIGTSSGESQETVGAVLTRVCTAWEVITFSAKEDSEATVRAVRELNVRRSVICA